jgi:hypothetical protein
MVEEDMVHIEISVDDILLFAKNQDISYLGQNASNQKFYFC